MKNISILLFCFASLIILSSEVFPQSDLKPIIPGERDKCPVCGMFVKDYPEWWCEIIFENGSAVFFDGPRDLFKFLIHPENYGVQKKLKNRMIYLREYYSLKWIDAAGAYYVIDSDVVGPMGNELIPLSTKDDADEFKSDHAGSRILKFGDIDWQLLSRLSQGEEM